ncbi:hypothetical protein LTR53_008570 [Teratosphaeriaceae sp. CCFEE 6253]|nr:hypothetical protein LTR53_008570 [Teratosphaeriaceae sp. CCFEE 6253]
MHSSAYLALVVALISAVYAVSIPGLPACAGECVTSFGSCSQLAVQCICSDTTLLANLACCVGHNCDATDQNTTITFADALCAGQGVTNLPSAATCAPGAASTPLGTSTAASGSSTLSSGSSSGTATTSAPASGSSTAATSAVSSASESAVGAGSSAAASGSAAATSASSAAAAATLSPGELARGVGSVHPDSTTAPTTSHERQANTASTWTTGTQARGAQDRHPTGSLPSSSAQAHPQTPYRSNPTSSMMQTTLVAQAMMPNEAEATPIQQSALFAMR